MEVGQNSATRGKRLGSGVVFYGIWTVFLATSVIWIVASDHHLVVKALGIAGVGLFGAAWVWQGAQLEANRADPNWEDTSPIRSALLVSLGLAVIASLLVPVIGLGVTTLAPYFATVGLFRLRMVPALVWVTVILSTTTGLALLTTGHLLHPAYIGPTIGVFVVTLARV